jgi:hypothetical protein
MFHRITDARETVILVNTAGVQDVYSLTDEKEP